LRPLRKAVGGSPSGRTSAMCCERTAYSLSITLRVSLQLVQNAPQCANGQVAMQRTTHPTSACRCLLLQHHVTAALPHLLKAQLPRARIASRPIPAATQAYAASRTAAINVGQQSVYQQTAGTPPGKGSVASFRLATASSTVCPWLTVPISGHSAHTGVLSVKNRREDHRSHILLLVRPLRAVYGQLA